MGDRIGEEGWGPLGPPGPPSLPLGLPGPTLPPQN